MGGVGVDITHNYPLLVVSIFIILSIIFYFIVLISCRNKNATNEILQIKSFSYSNVSCNIGACISLPISLLLFWTVWNNNYGAVESVLVIIVSGAFGYTAMSLYKKRLKKEFAPCPYCGFQTKIIDEWECYECKQPQSEIKSLFIPCERCGCLQNSAFCEHCEKEYLL